MENLKDFVAKFDFLEEPADGDYDHEAAKRFVIENVTLPSFYTFPDPTPVYTVHIVSPSDVHLLDVEGNDLGTFENVENAYDHAQSELHGDVVFTGDIKSITGEDDPLWISVPSSKGFSRMLISHTDADGEYLAKSNYLHFLRSVLSYEANPDNFVEAWYFVDNHPAFWTRYPGDREDWNTNHNSDVWIGVGVRDDKTPYIMLETGQAVPPERTSRYHDLRLDVYEDTYELAFIALAKLVHKFFDIDGSERPDVEYEKSELELTLESRLEEYENQKAENEAEASQNF